MLGIFFTCISSIANLATPDLRILAFARFASEGGSVMTIASAVTITSLLEPLLGRFLVFFGI